MPVVVWTVTEATVADGRGWTATTRYTYSGGVWSLTDEEFRGFSTVTVTDPAGNRAVTAFHQDNTKKGQVAWSRVEDASGRLFSLVQHAYTDVAPFPGVAWPRLDRTDAFEYDGGTTPRQTAILYTYDTHGNPTRVLRLGDVSVAGDERDGRTDWLVDTSRWIHRPTRTALHDSAGAIIRERWLSYDGLAWGALGARGLLTREELRLTGPRGTVGNPTIAFAYDAFGNRTSTADPRNCTTTTAFEAGAIYPASVTTCLNFTTTFQYDARWGTKTSERDPNGHTTTATYDVFGRLVRVTGPLDTASANGTVSHLYVDFGNPAAQRIVTNRTEQHGTANVVWSEQYFDGLGRAYLDRVEGPGGQVIVQERTFDARGLLRTQSAPRFPSETSVLTTVVYDALGRPIDVMHPDGTHTRTAYTPGLRVLTDRRGNVRRHGLDAHAQLVRVEELNAAETYVTTYAYDAAGGLTRVTNHLGHVTTMTYDRKYSRFPV